MENRTTKEEIRRQVLSMAEDEGGFASGSLSEENDIVGVLGFDSLDRIDFINSIENFYGLRFSIEEEEKMRTFKDIIDAIWNKIK